MYGRIDLVISSDIEAPSNIKSIGHSMKDLEQVYIFRQSSSYIMLSPQTSASTVKKWENAFREVTRNMDSSVSKWSSILGFPLGYSEKTGYYVK